MRVLPLLFLLALIAVPFLRAQVIEDDFDDGNDDEWTKLDPIGVATFSDASSDDFRISTAVTPDPGIGQGRGGAIREQATYNGAFYVAVDVVNWDQTAIQDLGILAFVTDAGPGTLDGYTMSYNNDLSTAYISKLVDEIPMIIVQADVPLMDGTPYRFILQHFNGEFLGEIYDANDLETPLAVIFAIDTSYNTGVCGIFNAGSEVADRSDVTYDNYYSSPDTDVDLDGLTDQWEVDNFGDLFCSGNEDNDGDGQDNEYEFLTGTDPTDANSRYRLTGVSEAGGELTITFPIIPGRVYELETSPNLEEWTLQEEAVFTEDGATGTLSIAAGGATPFFGRVVVGLE